MRLLLDTHSFLWFIGGTSELSDLAKSLIQDSDNDVLLSIASLWEIAIKVSLEKLSLGKSFGELIPQQIAENSIRLLNISIAHTVAVTTLPFHHRDPFDRLLIAQAMVEKIPIVSRDRVFDAYEIERLW
jgi:PIN domain nuclease of toxin-antitoxin system